MSEPLPYRAWSLSAYNNIEMLEATLDRTLKEAPRHNINCIEITDYTTVPLVGWVDAPTTFRNYPKLAQAPQLTYGAIKRTGVGGSPKSGVATLEERMAIAKRLKAIAKRVRDAGLELQVWYHCFRGWPDETMQYYPELRDADAEPVYAFLADTLRDAFEFFPEITGLTVTSLHETPSILRFAGNSSQFDRMYKLYSTLSGVCEEHGRRLILRDFINTKAVYDEFERVLDKLPDSVMIMTKNVVSDWGAHEKPVNSFISRYARNRKRFIVEFELANNYTGEIDFPWCDPEQIWRHIRLLAALKAHGAVGRLVNSDRIQSGTIFDAPNEVNVWAFSRTLSDPGRLLDKPEDSWGQGFDSFDGSLWTDWAKLRYGETAASEIVHILQQTPRMVSLTLNLCGRFFAMAWWFVGDDHKYDMHLRSVLPTLQRCGHAHALAEKTEARLIVEEAIARIERLRPLMPAEGYHNVRDAFERARHIVSIYTAITGALLCALDVESGKRDAKDMKRATDAIRTAAGNATAAYNDHLFDCTPMVALSTADYFDRLPGRIASVMDGTSAPPRRSKRR